MSIGKTVKGDEAIAAAIGQATGKAFCLRDRQGARGGCIHRAEVFVDGDRRFFVKRNAPDAATMFLAEADGLGALAASGALRLPGVICQGANDDESWLVLEYLPLVALDRVSAARLGEALAALHRLPVGDAFGWPADNFIGSTPQHNQPYHGWAYFFAERRLRPQLQRALGRGLDRRLFEAGERLTAGLAAFFVDEVPRPSLLHGDLWSGNAAALPDGRPVIFDPAVYRGDREADIAMAELFGGFPESFYAAYRAAWPLSAGYETRKTLYNLYHILNHFNLFGGGYLGQARRMIERLLAELR